jgi:serine phosphatase RsbU (regulator of sigma subunit)
MAIRSNAEQKADARMRRSEREVPPARSMAAKLAEGLGSPAVSEDPRDEQIAHLRARARADRREIAELRADAVERDAKLLAAQARLAAAELELEDLRAVRDVLTPPALPQLPGILLDATYEPAGEGVGGDFYLAVAGPDDATVVVVGDVVGKGIDAARNAAFVRATFALAAGFTAEPCGLLTWVNEALVESEGFGERFATAVCASWMPRERTLRWALAGHPPPLDLQAGEPLDDAPPAPPLGLEPDLSCHGGDLHLDPGRGVLLYTDGLVEARADGQLFGAERAARILREGRGEQPATLLERLREAAAAFAGGHLQDDLCMLAMRAA